MPKIRYPRGSFKGPKFLGLSFKEPRYMYIRVSFKGPRYLRLVSSF